MTHFREATGLIARVNKRANVARWRVVHAAVTGGVVAMMLATASCGSSLPDASYGPDLTGIEMAALQGDPWAIGGLTPVQRQRVSAYQANHPGIAPSWGRDVVNAGMGAGAGYLLHSTMSSATQGGAAVTTGAATEEAAALAPEAAGVGAAGEAGGEVAAVGEAAVVSEAAETAVTVNEAAEGVGILEALIEGCIFIYCR